MCSLQGIMNYLEYACAPLQGNNEAHGYVLLHRSQKGTSPTILASLIDLDLTTLLLAVRDAPLRAFWCPGLQILTFQDAVVPVLAVNDFHALVRPLLRCSRRYQA